MDGCGEIVKPLCRNMLGDELKILWSESRRLRFVVDLLSSSLGRMLTESCQYVSLALGSSRIDRLEEVTESVANWMWPRNLPESEVRCSDEGNENTIKKQTTSANSASAKDIALALPHRLRTALVGLFLTTLILYFRVFQVS